MTNKFTLKDFWFSIFTGALTGFAAWQVAKNLEVENDLVVRLLPWLILIVPVLWIIGVNLGYFLGRWIGFFNQFGKFAAVGFTNTAVDFAILNILSSVTGITAGGQVILLNAASFTTATIGSYLFNKYWVFDDNVRVDESKKFSLFLVVSVIGIGINSAIVYVITTLVDAQLGLNENQWLNIAKVMASVLSLLWNFVGYKLFVFKK